VKGLSLDAKLLKEVDTKPSGKSDAKFKITGRIIVQSRFGLIRLVGEQLHLRMYTILMILKRMMYRL
jgi:hypothetical protein